MRAVAFDSVGGAGGHRVGPRHGILFRGGAAVEKLAEVNVVALDKTGTLTTGELRVEKVESFPPG